MNKYYNSNKEIINKDINNYYLQWIGLFFYIITFALMIPYFLLKNKYYSFIQMYFQNLDLIATCLNFQGGPFDLQMFKYLYSSTTPFVGYISYNLIAFLALLGVAAVILKRMEDNKIYKKQYPKERIAYFMSFYTITLIITFLFPNRYIRQFNEYFNTILKNNINLNKNILWLITIIGGLIVSFFVILLEGFINKSIINSYFFNLYQLFYDIIKKI